ncbi:hypothetical protein BJ508DRAFT_322913 [Ascobolus immersus RN42]|uniref:Uncharacterized protein n=1 Tax=Ascobolus immersus RN42 TaxID=1160509 RepID=A0A3N4IG13_ASCIM|nr:hypothetical protein BJ508DRAFT_322913 [Ascobolus immersus RN42]
MSNSKSTKSGSSKPKFASKRSKRNSSSSSSPPPSSSSSCCSSSDSEPPPKRRNSNKASKSSKKNSPPPPPASPPRCGKEQVPPWLPAQHKCGLCTRIIGGPQSRTKCLEAHEWVCEAFHHTVFMLDNWHHCSACSNMRATRHTKRKEIKALKEQLFAGRASGDLSQKEIRDLRRKIESAEKEYEFSVIKTTADTSLRELAYTCYTTSRSILTPSEITWLRYWRSIMNADAPDQLPREPKEPRPVYGKRSRIAGCAKKYAEVMQYVKDMALTRADPDEEVDRLFYMWRVVDTEGVEERMLELPEVIWKLCEEKLSGGDGKGPKR